LSGIMIAKVENGGIVVSKGLAWMVGIAATVISVLVVPWAYRVESNLSKAAIMMARIDERSSSWKDQALAISTHIIDGAAMEAKLSALEQRVVRLEMQGAAAGYTGYVRYAVGDGEPDQARPRD